MIEILSVQEIDNYIRVGFIISGFDISARVYNFKGLSPQEIIIAAFDKVESDVYNECVRLGREFDNELPVAIDEVISINLLGIENVNFIEGQQSIVKTLRCAGHTRYGSDVDVKAETVFSLPTPVTGVTLVDDILTIAPTEAVGPIDILATYGALTSSKSFSIIYKSLAEIEADNAANAAAEEARAAEMFISMKDYKKKELSASCNAAIVAGFPSTVKFGVEKIYELQLENQLNMVGLLNDVNLKIAVGLDPPTTIAYYPKGEACVDYTIAEFSQLCLEATAFKNANITKYKGLITQLVAATTAEEVNAIVW